eukprot:TRINITY_DN3225_c0_g2_i1.p1 TRINITY_DN3225_c0_g2~~TRINITY_DN3225_c0_g2_i1.p1  ORF type:complete len:400 (-),score=74.56 TRINITY_DN3225_c0_g2_i1:165-1295(-)
MAASQPGKLMTMPVLIVNMGGEMVYILEQRLQAQKIPESKGQKVLNDVVRTMYYPRFIEELFKPQEMYSIQSTRQIFDRLAHSSIMRLNESSMDKLFDLMAMGFKYQIISCVQPRDIVDVTMNHLEALKKLVGSHTQLIELLDECVRQINLAYGNMSFADFNALRQSLCAFFQDRKVKVSLFLQGHTQNHDGSIVVPSSGNLTPGHLPPGTVRYFQGGQEVGCDALQPVSVNAWNTVAQNRTSLGSNLYEKDRAGAPESAPPAAPVEPAAPPAPCLPAPAPPAKDDPSTAAAVGELNMLASLIGAQPAREEDHFKLTGLFGADVFSKDTSARAAEVIEIDGTVPCEHLESIKQSMEGLGGAEAEGHDDLLDLMDKA